MPTADKAKALEPAPASSSPKAKLPEGCIGAQGGPGAQGRPRGSRAHVWGNLKVGGACLLRTVAGFY